MKSRCRGAANGGYTGNIDAGEYMYYKKFYIPDEYSGGHIMFQFEGIYQNAGIFINQSKIGGNVYGYTDFTVDAGDYLRYGEENEILVVLTVRGGKNILDQSEIVSGIRKLSVDSRHGLRVNGRTVKLRGACIHHDQGILGAATYDGYEYRRVKRLKEVGFNAVRSAHNPASQALLNACDQLGVYVMDELTDVWNKSKVSYDYSASFGHCWESDMEHMVEADYNHPSVIFYSTGNEIFEICTEKGFETSRMLGERFHELDPGRYTTNGINGAFAAGDLSVIGNRRPISFYREIVFGLTKKPCIAVQNPKDYGISRNFGPWRYTDCTFNYTYEGCEGKPVMIQVYGGGDSVELFLNGRSLGIHPCGRETKYETQYDTVYEPGELVAVAYENGKEVGRSSLMSSKRASRAVLSAEKYGSLMFINMDITDENGCLVADASVMLSIRIEGPASVLAFGAVGALHQAGYGHLHTTAGEGHALAILKRSGEAGIVKVAVSGDGLEETSIVFK